MIFPRDHYYLVICDNCDYVSHHNKKPFAAQRYAKRHSTHALAHRVCVIDVQTLSTVKIFQQDVLPGTGNDPPF